jgi:RNA polymerase sigma factor (sigma-70 family)
MKTDEEYLERLRLRDQATSTHFYYSFAPVLENMVRYRCWDKTAAEDIRNETLRRVILINDKGQVRDPECFGGFVRGVCKMVIREYEEKKRRLSPWPEGLEPLDGKANVEDVLLDKELIGLLRHELEKLTPKELKLVDQVYYKRRDRKDLAIEEGVTPSGINVRLFKIFKKLRRGLQDKGRFGVSPKQRDAAGHKSKEGLDHDTSRRSDGRELANHVRAGSTGR